MTSSEVSRGAMLDAHQELGPRVESGMVPVGLNAVELVTET
ncbi:hypothetical protein [Kitasatospora sp. NPDC059571]